MERMPVGRLQSCTQWWPRPQTDMLQQEKTAFFRRLFMLLRCHVTLGVIRETENSRDGRWEASGRHKTQKYVLIRTFHLVRLDFIVCAVSVNVLVMGVQLLHHERLNTLSVESNIDFIYQQKPIGAFWIFSTVREDNKSKGRKKMRVCVGDVLQTLFLQSLLCCCAASVISGDKSQLFYKSC